MTDGSPRTGITVRMIVQGKAVDVEYQEAASAKVEDGALVLRAAPGNTRLTRTAEVIGAVAKGTWQRWRWTDAPEFERPST